MLLIINTYKHESPQCFQDHQYLQFEHSNHPKKNFLITLNSLQEFVICHVHVYVRASTCITSSLGVFVGLFLGDGLGIGFTMYNASLPKHLNTKIALHCISNRHASTAIIQAIYMYTYLKKFVRNKFCSVQFIIKAQN